MSALTKTRGPRPAPQLTPSNSFRNCLDFLLGDGSHELFDMSKNTKVLLEIVGCTGLVSQQHHHHATSEDANGSSSSLGSQESNSHVSLESGRLARSLSRSSSVNHHHHDHHQDQDSNGENKGAASTSLDNFHDNMPPTQCIVKLAGMEIHRTKACTDDPANPIWTVRTNSLCTMDLPLLPTTTTSKDDSHELQKDSFSSLEHQETPAKKLGIQIEVWGGGHLIGTVALSLEQIRDVLKEQPGQRVEVDIIEKSATPFDFPPVMALRIRPATLEDLIFLNEYEDPREEELKRIREKRRKESVNHQLHWKYRPMHKEASDLDFVHLEPPTSIFQAIHKKLNGEEYNLTKPGPDPDRIKETKWLTGMGLDVECMKPSFRYVHAGNHPDTIGRCYVEILECRNLPNMDLDLTGNNKTDPFVGILFEDSLLRTDMIWDELSPRWLPWTMRAFCLHIRHPASLLFLGVFDYDPEGGDAVGRVAIKLSEFQSEMEYDLLYNLQHDPQIKPSDSNRGQIRFRLRIEWDDTEEATRRLFGEPPPKCIINCKSQRSFRVLRYLKRGLLDLETSSLNAIKVHATEAASYWLRICNFLDILFEVLLWRGRWFGVWCPHHSVALFLSVLFCLERPEKAGSVILMSISWMLLTINFHNCRHPYPWKRSRNWFHLAAYLYFGHRKSSREPIRPHQGVERDRIMEKVDEWRGKRMSALIQETLGFFDEVGKIMGSNQVTADFFSTAKNEGWDLSSSVLKPALELPHTLLKLFCKNSRLFVQFINWDGFGANFLVVNCFVAAVIWWFVPVHIIFHWVLRILAWTFLGPWMKLLDIFVVHKWYKTSEELYALVESGVEELEPNLPDFNKFLDNEFFAEKMHTGRLLKENAMKLKAMREHVFGEYSEFIPIFDDNGRYRNVPCPESSASPYVRPQTASVPEHDSESTKSLTGKLVRFSGNNKEAAYDEKEALMTHVDKRQKIKFVKAQKLFGHMIMSVHDAKYDKKVVTNSKQEVPEKRRKSVERREDRRMKWRKQLNENKDLNLSLRDYSNGEEFSKIHTPRRQMLQKSVSAYIKVE